MKDWRGNDFEVGDSVLWPHVSGHSLSMMQGRVLEITEIKTGWQAGKPVVVIQPESTSRYGWRFRYAAPDLPRPVRLTITENITVITEAP